MTTTVTPARPALVRFRRRRGLGRGATGTSLIFLGSIVALVAFFSVTERDQAPPVVLGADSDGRFAPRPRG